MTRKIILLPLIAFIFLSIQTKGQTGKPSPKTVASKIVAQEPGKCTCYSDSMDISKYTIEAVNKWLEMLPLTVKCANKKIYKISSFEFTVFTMNPLANKTYGAGDAKDIPLLGKRALPSLKAGDTIILKNVKTTGEEGKEMDLPSVSIKLE
jgi:hypothetical protein